MGGQARAADHPVMVLEGSHLRKDCRGKMAEVRSAMEKKEPMRSC